VLIVTGTGLLLLSFAAKRKNDKEVLQSIKQANSKNVVEESEMDKIKKSENVYQLLEVEPIEMEFGYSLIPLVDEGQGGTFIDKVVIFRRQFAMETGIVIPSVRMRDNIQLENNIYQIKIRGEIIAEGKVFVSNLMIMNPTGDGFAIAGIDTVEPAFGLKARWIPESRREEAEMAGYTVIEPGAVMMTHLSEIIRHHSYELLGRKEVNSLLDMVKKSNPSLVDEVVPTKITVGDLQKIMQNLLRENVPIRDMVTVLETISDHALKIKDTDLLTEFVRQSLKRSITHKLAPDGKLSVLTIDPQVEKLISASVRQSDHGSYLAVEPDTVQEIINNLTREVEKCSQLSTEPVVLVSPTVRMYFKKLTEQVLPDLTVISYNELENHIKVQAVGAIAA
jgi:flagellar biosynthesis protein FlhA